MANCSHRAVTSSSSALIPSTKWWEGEGEAEAAASAPEGEALADGALEDEALETGGLGGEALEHEATAFARCAARRSSSAARAAAMLAPRKYEVPTSKYSNNYWSVPKP